MLAIKDILVATDFSASSEVALGYGREFAQRFGARLHLVHVSETLLADGFNLDGQVAAGRDQSELREDDRRQLTNLLTEYDRHSLRATVTLLPPDTPANAIVAYARDQKIDLIVIGTHGRRGLSHIVMGSVAEKVVRNATCPVLTVRRREPDAATSDQDETAGGR